jgi:hypothetical protein
MDTISGSEGHKRNKWIKADFDPVSFQAEEECSGSPKMVLPAGGWACCAETPSKRGEEGSKAAPGKFEVKRLGALSYRNDDMAVPSGDYFTSNFAGSAQRTWRFKGRQSGCARTCQRSRPMARRARHWLFAQIGVEQGNAEIVIGLKLEKLS